MKEEVILELKHIQKKYGNHLVLDDVTFRLGKGEVHALVGENGAGKSTLVKAGAGCPDLYRRRASTKEQSCRDAGKRCHSHVSGYQFIPKSFRGREYLYGLPDGRNIPKEEILPGSKEDLGFYGLPPD